MKNYLIIFLLIPFSSFGQSIIGLPQDTLIKQVKKSGWEYKLAPDSIKPERVEYMQGEAINVAYFHKGVVSYFEINEPAANLNKRKQEYDDNLYNIDKQYAVGREEWKWFHYDKAIQFLYEIIIDKQTGNFKTRVSIWKKH